MPDWSSLLGNVGSALGSAGQTAGNVLSNPLTQAALASYFGAISAPKHTSTLGRIGLGGLSGLQQYGEAEQQKNRAQLTGAEVDRAKAQAGYDQLQTQAYQNMTPEQRTAAFGGWGGQMYQQGANATANKALAGQIKAGIDSGAFGVPTSDTYKRAQTFMGLALQETNKALGPEDINNFVFKGATEEQKGQAETKKAEAETSLAQARQQQELPAHVSEMQAQAEKARREAQTTTASGVKVGSKLTANGKVYEYRPNDPLAIKDGALAGYVEMGTSGTTKETKTADPVAEITKWKAAHKFQVTPYSGDDIVAGIEAAGVPHDKAVAAVQAAGYDVSGGGAPTPPHAETGEGLPEGSKKNADGTWTLPDGRTVAPM